MTTPFSFVASANCLLYEHAKPGVLRHRPAHAQHRPRRGGRGGRRAHHGPAAGAHLRLSGRHAGVRAPGRRARPVARRGRLRGARRDARGWDARGRARQPERVRLLPEQADHDGGGRRGGVRRRPTPRSASTPSATRVARPTWAGSTTTGSASTTGSTTSPARSGVAQLERLDELLAARARVAGALLGGAGRTSRGSSCPAPTRAATGAAGSSTWCSCRPAWTATPPSTAMRERGVDTKPYLPAIHLMSFYRERFGHREGEFPVCEDVAAPLARAALLPASSPRARWSRWSRRCARSIELNPAV